MEDPYQFINKAMNLKLLLAENPAVDAAPVVAVHAGPAAAGQAHGRVLEGEPGRPPHRPQGQEDARRPGRRVSTEALYRVTIHNGKNLLLTYILMFRNPAWAIGSYNNSPPAA